jgi:hypothetical protein
LIGKHPDTRLVVAPGPGSANHRQAAGPDVHQLRRRGAGGGEYRRTIIGAGRAAAGLEQDGIRGQVLQAGAISEDLCVVVGSIARVATRNHRNRSGHRDRLRAVPGFVDLGEVVCPFPPGEIQARRIDGLRAGVGAEANEVIAACGTADEEHGAGGHSLVADARHLDMVIGGAARDHVKQAVCGYVERATRIDVDRAGRGGIEVVRGKADGRVSGGGRSLQCHVSRRRADGNLADNAKTEVVNVARHLRSAGAVDVRLPLFVLMKPPDTVASPFSTTPWFCPDPEVPPTPVMLMFPVPVDFTVDSKMLTPRLVALAGSVEFPP